MDFDLRPFDIAGSSMSWLGLLGVLTLIVVGVAFALAMARNGSSGIRVFFSGLLSYLDDIGSISPRRVMALTTLTLREAVRRKALLVFVVFAILLMFAGWFLTDSNDRAELQVKQHVTTLFTVIAWPLVIVVIFLSCWALPEDIRIRSLHTVVTKPARRLEIVIGRMLGMSLVALIVLGVMGVIGGFWIIRMIPEASRSQLVCRVPLFGELYFLSPEGQPSATGVNTGDTWLFRSNIAGNSRARAVWLFQNVDDSALVKGSVPEASGAAGEAVDGIKLECRFEAFRTIKGSEKSIRQGLQAQYTLSANPREEAFGMISQSEALRPLADALRDAQFRTAAERTKELAARLRTAPEELRPQDQIGLQYGLLVAYAVLRDLKDPRMGSVPELFGEAADAGSAVLTSLQKNEDADTKDPVPYPAYADALDAVAAGLAENADGLHESLAKLEIPLPPFHISEYHEGAAENVVFIPRKLRFAADYESQGRFLAGIFEEWNAAGKLVQGDTLNDNLSMSLAQDAGISTANAEHLVTVLKEQLSGGTLKVTDGKLAVADDRRWFAFFDEIIRKELLISQDSEGWVIEKDLIQDFTRKGTLRVEVACLNDQMYLGMARPDLFLRKPDRSFYVGYSKAILNTGLMLLLIIVLGVTVSCIVKGPVALFFTLAFFIVGQFFHEFMMKIVTGQEEGSGMLQSAVLIAQHRNPQVGMDVPETTQAVIEGVDKGLEGILRGFSNIIPDFSAFNRGAAFVENGFDVPFRDAVLPSIAMFAGFLIPCVLLAGAMLKFRELESK